MQFTAPGWRYLSVASGGCGYLPGGGSYVTLVPPQGAAAGFTLILETLHGACNHCGNEGPVASTADTVTFRLTGGLPPPGTTLYQWQTNAMSWFVPLPPLTVAPDGTITVTIGADAQVTVTTVASGSHGAVTTPVPPSAPFPAPYADDFSGYGYDAVPRFFADQAGSFAVRNGSLQQVVPLNPGANAWVPNASPVTILGDATGTWRDYAVAVTATMPPDAPALAPADAWIYAQLQPCDASSPLQMYRWNESAPAYLQLDGLPAPDASLCLNVLGCQTDVIFYPCVVSGGTCCGADCYANLQWAYDAATGRLTSQLDGHCVTAPTSGGIVVAACGAAGNQTWAFVPSASGGGGGDGGGSGGGTLQLQLASSPPLCLAMPAPPPPLRFLQLCARLGDFDTFAPPPMPNAYCLQLLANGSWAITTSAATLASGLLPGGVATGVPQRLLLTVNGTAITVAINGSVLAVVQDASLMSGQVALGSGWHAAAFDDFAVTPLAAQ